MLTTYYLKLKSTGIFITAFLLTNYQLKSSLTTRLSWIFKNKDHGASKRTTRWPVLDFDVYDFIKNYELDFGISATLKLCGRIFYMIDILDVLHTVGEKFTDHTDHAFYQHSFPCLLWNNFIYKDVLTQGYSTVVPSLF